VFQIVERSGTEFDALNEPFGPVTYNERGKRHLV
jgi:hypothetical protein